MARTTGKEDDSDNRRATREGRKATRRQTIGDEIAEGLEELADALERDAEVPKEFNCRQMRFHFKTGSYTPKKVRQTRRRIHCSQAVFAEVMGVTPNAVRSWEQGSRPPSKTACRLMDVINREPSRWMDMLADVAVVKRLH